MCMHTLWTARITLIPYMHEDLRMFLKWLTMNEFDTSSKVVMNRDDLTHLKRDFKYVNEEGLVWLQSK